MRSKTAIEWTSSPIAAGAPIMFHDGTRDLQDKYGGRKVADAIAKHRTHFEFTDEDRDYIKAAMEE